MSNVISWADAVKALEAIAKEQQAVSGMSVAEAATALNYTKTAGGMYVKTVITSSAESIAGTSAAGVASSATATATTSAVNLTLVEGSGGVAEVAGIGSIALPVASCLVASVGGYLIGNQVYKSNSTFLDKLMFPLYDFITGQHVTEYVYGDKDAPTVPVLYDVNGNAFLPSGGATGIKAYLDTLGKTPPVGDQSYITEALQYIASNPTYQYYAIIYNINSNYYQVLYATTPLYVEEYGHENPSTTLAIRFETGGLCHCYDSYNSTHFVNSSSNHELIVDTIAGRWHFFYSRIVACGTGLDYNGTPLYTPPEPLPSGVTKYTPVTPATSPVTTPDGKTWTKVYLPSTAPIEMPDGKPVPETAPDPANLDPYIAPVQPQPAGVPIKIPTTDPTTPLVIPNPEPDTSTVPYPAPNPATDPSQLATPSTPSATEPIPDPINTGAPVVPIVPSSPLPTSAKGLLHVYNPTTAQVDAFGEWLWTTFSGDLIDTVGKLFNNPMDAVIGLHEIYCTPTESAADVNIRAGFLESNVASRLVTERYIEIKCGALSVPEYWGNYLDYSPYTKSYCYLPFIGIVELNTDDIVGSGVEITYRVDVYNGSCIALITTAKPNSAESVTYQFEGNCSVSVPITSGMMTSVQNALIGVATTALGAAATAAVTVATGGTALPAAVMLGSVAAGSAQHGLTSKNQVQYSGSFGSSYGAMGIKKPFLIIKRPRQKVVYGYNTNYGYPSHKMVLVSTCTGYLRAREVDVISPTATEAEKKMIEQLLKSGVFVD